MTQLCCVKFKSTLAGEINSNNNAIQIAGESNRLTGALNFNH